MAGRTFLHLNAPRCKVIAKDPEFGNFTLLFAEDSKDMYRIENVRPKPLFCLLNLLFSDVLATLLCLKLARDIFHKTTTKSTRSLQRPVLTQTTISSDWSSHNSLFLITKHWLQNSSQNVKYLTGGFQTELHVIKMRKTIVLISLQSDLTHLCRIV